MGKVNEVGINKWLFTGRAIKGALHRGLRKFVNESLTNMNPSKKESAQIKEKKYASKFSIL